MKYLLQLKVTLEAAGWSQEQLASQLDVSFPTLNSWLNERSQPRPKAVISIEKLYLDTVGVEHVDADQLRRAKAAAVRLKSTPQKIARNQKILDNLTLYLTYHSNTIEGSTMTVGDVEEVIFEHKVLSNRTAVEQAEARNHQAALWWLIEQLAGDDRTNNTNRASGNKIFVIDEALVLGIQLRLMNGIISDAGQYRRHTVRIMGSRVALANWQKVPDLVAQLVADIQHPSSDIIGDLARAHATFERIHPFSDGNGRTGRLLLLAQALQAGLLPPLVAKERKHAYYKYLELAQTKGEYRPLELFIAESMAYSHELLKLT
jgi:Fic family protein/DNA-binding XRE family transcriptional regulator